ncbi:hypothetical protein [Petroclostridium sp. X23]|uniref:hypothetical protein n=1 Tax=Petroclostridium sp. X23 TaxID=3045146 RepID=UPI0024ACA8C3|nr:hypothetical protein [Petroclostridium sp. X23]WHH59234.1 hypothetical protein QKW49_00240 [Petroclostridium sp. X23]
MYYTKQQIEELAKRAEEQAEKMKKEKEKQEKGFKFSFEDGEQIICIYCKHDRFHKGSALLNTRGATFFDMDWLNDSAVTLTCKKCGYIHWFAREVKEN